MEISISFNPERDELSRVVRTITAAYGQCEECVIQQAGDLRVEAHGPAAVAALLAGEPMHPSGITGAEMKEAAQVQQQAQGLTAEQAFTTGAAATTQAASTPNANTSTASGAAVELDARGLPWDKRIHSDAAERKTAKGEWKKRRGVHESVVDQVEKELLAALAAGGGAPQPGLATIPPGGVIGGAQVHPVADGPAPVAVVQPVVTVPEPTARSFAGLMAHIMPHMKTPGTPNGVLQMRHLSEIAHRLNLIDPATGRGEIRMLEHCPDLLDTAYQWADWFVANPNAPFLGKE